MSDASPTPELPDSLAAWVETQAKGQILRAQAHFAGASRAAWTLDVSVGGGERGLFLLRDKGQGGGSARDAAVLNALAGTAVPVPEVVGLSSDASTILLERLPGRSDFPAVDRDAEREPTARHLMEITARLHAIEIERLEIPHLAVPTTPEDCARGSLDQARAACSALGDRADPFFTFALGWLDSSLPRDAARYALVHSDMGPGNFLYEKGRVTGIVDWEVAHFGDPMEDLAAISVRDMATPVGNLATRFREYEEASGIPVDLDRVNYYRALVLVRNSLMIGLGLANPPEGFDVVEMTMYQTLLMRAAALVICDCLGIERPRASAATPDLDGLVQRADRAPDPTQRGLLTAISRDWGETVEPALRDAPEGRIAHRVQRALETLEHAGRVGPSLDELECADIDTWIGGSVASSSDAKASLEARLRDVALEALASAGAREAAASYFGRRLHRQAERNRPLMGELFERLPQPLTGPEAR